MFADSGILLSPMHAGFLKRCMNVYPKVSGQQVFCDNYNWIHFVLYLPKREYYFLQPYVVALQILLSILDASANGIIFVKRDLQLRLPQHIHTSAKTTNFTLNYRNCLFSQQSLLNFAPCHLMTFTVYASQQLGMRKVAFRLYATETL